MKFSQKSFLSCLSMFLFVCYIAQDSLTFLPWYDKMSYYGGMQ
jgi:hypothetical protein